jgi:hypothetical protein
MKSLACILSIYIASLAIIPSGLGVYKAFSADKCTGTLHDCCSKKQAETKQDQHNPMNCCSSGLCNPFASCCFFFNEGSEFNFTDLSSSNVIGSAEMLSLVSSYTSDCFRPPEVV